MKYKFQKGGNYVLPAYVPEKQVGESTNISMPTPQYNYNGYRMDSPLPEYNNPSDTQALKNSSRVNTSPTNMAMSGDSTNTNIDTLRYLSYRKLLSENNSPHININNSMVDNSLNNRAHYNPITNTVNVLGMSDLISEIAHAAQNNIIGKGIGDWFKSPYLTDKQYLKQYNIPVSVEYDAHKVIEPQLMNRYMDISDSIEKADNIKPTTLITGDGRYSVPNNSFQNGGEQNSEDSTDFFNNYVSSLVAQNQQNQQNDQQNNQQNNNDNSDDTRNYDQDSDYIRKLRSYDEEQSSEKQQQQQQQPNQDMIDYLKGVIDKYGQSLEEQQNNVDWFGSEDGIDSTRSSYDTQTSTTPVYNKPSQFGLGDLQSRQMAAESGGNDNALSPKGARGAYQFMPSTWDEFKPSPNASPNNRGDAAQAYQNYMQHLLTQYGGDQRKAVAAYNYGPGNVSKLLSQYGDTWESHLPEETKGYLQNVLGGIETKSPSVNLSNVNSQLLSIVGSASSQFPGIVVTSGDDSQHMANSAHYDGDAVDIGANSSNKAAYSNFKKSLPELQQKYGIKYLDEGNHIHLSLSRKGKT